MEVKVLCNCGAKYKFDVAPVQGRMPAPVACPVCGADGTEYANGVIAKAVPASGADRPVPSAIPLPSCPATGVSQTPAPTSARPEAPRLRINKPVQVVAPATPAVEPAPVPAAAAPSLRAPAPTLTAKTSLARSFLLGAVGAAGAGLLGMLGWYLLIKSTGYEIGYAAWGVGVLTGIGARILGRGGSTGLGVWAAGCAFIAVLGGQYLAAKSFADELTGDLETAARQSYDKRLAYAKEALQAQTDDEIKRLLAKEAAEEDGTPDPSQITAEDIQQFRDEELPKLRDFANGKPSREEYETDFKSIKDSWMFKFLILKSSFSLFTLLWLFLGMGSAYKLGSGSSD
jgi:hypothetical protein